jgi:hypothetical protein
MPANARALAVAEKYRCRSLPAKKSATIQKLQRRAKHGGQTVLPPLKTVHSLAKYHVPGAQFNPTQLVLEGGLSEAEWVNIGRAIAHVESSSKWWIGDWLMAGSKAYGKTAAYDLAQQATGQDKRVLYICTYVSKQI